MTELLHNKCGGRLNLDISSKIALVTPSYSFRANGDFTIGAVEIVETKSADTIPTFVCSKCNKRVEVGGEEILCRCNVCRRNRPVEEMRVSAEVSQVCSECVNDFERPISKVSSQVAEYKKLLSSLSSVSFRSMIEILKRPIKI